MFGVFRGITQEYCLFSYSRDLVRLFSTEQHFILSFLISAISKPRRPARKMPAAADVQAATLTKFLTAWKHGRANDTMALWSDDFTQRLLPLSLGAPCNSNAQAQLIYPKLVEALTNWKVSNFLHDDLQERVSHACQLCQELQERYLDGTLIQRPIPPIDQDLLGKLSDPEIFYQTMAASIDTTPFLSSSGARRASGATRPLFRSTSSRAQR